MHPTTTAARLAVPIPRRVAYLRRDARGYPVPFIVMWDAKGVPHFPISDAAKVEKVIRTKACSICGRPLAGPGWFVGGPKSFLHPQGAFLDPPMHHDCATYAMQVCPYIAAPSYARRLDDRKLTADAMPDGVAVVQEPGQDDRPAFFMLASAASWEVSGGNAPGMIVLRPTAPWHGIEVWRDGARVPEPEAAGMVAAALHGIERGAA